jgi:hypothetical protein
MNGEKIAEIFMYCMIAFTFISVCIFAATPPGGRRKLASDKK